MLQNAYFLAKIGADTAENERNFAELLPKTGNYPTGPPGRRPDATAGGAGCAERAREVRHVRLRRGAAASDAGGRWAGWVARRR